MKTLEQEAEEYAEFGKTNSKWQPIVQNAFIAGASSKWVQAEKIKVQIELIEELKTGVYNLGATAWYQTKLKLEQQLKQLEDEANSTK